MSNNGCKNRYNCLDIAVLASVIVGVIAGVLTFLATITLTPAFLWVIAGVAVVYLALLLFITSFSRDVTFCKFEALRAVLFGILGTILFSVILLGVTFAATSVVGAIFAGLAVGFFALTITATACLIKRNVTCNN